MIFVDYRKFRKISPFFLIGSVRVLCSNFYQVCTSSQYLLPTRNAVEIIYLANYRGLGIPAYRSLTLEFLLLFLI